MQNAYDALKLLSRVIHNLLHLPRWRTRAIAHHGILNLPWTWWPKPSLSGSYPWGQGMWCPFLSRSPRSISAQSPPFPRGQKT